jgi:hypothetical protein
MKRKTTSSATQCSNHKSQHVYTPKVGRGGELIVYAVAKRLIVLSAPTYPKGGGRMRVEGQSRGGGGVLPQCPTDRPSDRHLGDSESPSPVCIFLYISPAQNSSSPVLALG